MKQILTLAIAAVLATSLLGSNMVYAQSSDDNDNTSSIQQLVERLLEQIKDLQKRLDALKEKRNQNNNTEDGQAFAQEIRERLRMGDNNTEVRKLQELLASDSDIYPERLVTGYFGPLTQSALARFQARHGVNPTGELDDTTKALINEYFAKRGNGETPQGILRAPGIKSIVERGVCDRIRGNAPFCPNDRDYDDKDEDEDDDEKSDKDDAAADAKDAIDDAQEDIAELEAELDEYGDTLSTADRTAAEAFLAEAKSKLDEAQAAYDDADYEEAETLAEAAEKAAKAGDSLVEDPDDDDDDDDEDDDQSTS